MRSLSRLSSLNYLGSGGGSSSVNKPNFFAPLKSSLSPQRGTGSATFTRATSATVTDFEGIIKTVKSGEARFEGARRVENLLTPSATLAAGASITVTIPAGTYVFSMGAGSNGVAGFSGTSGAGGILNQYATNRTAKTFTLTAGTFIVTASVAGLIDLQLENVTGQANQNPSEYVSNGVLSAPYHGAGADGVKYFTTQNGNTVSTVNVVVQTWLDQNMKVGTMLASGSTLPTNNGTIEKWCYNNDPAICATDGGLYNWDEAMQYSTTEGAQGICPTGWHIPTDAEQNNLDQYLTDSGQTCNANRIGTWDCNTAGTKLKVGGTSGFNALLSGHRYTDGSFLNRTAYTNLWSSSGSGSSTAWHRSLNSGSVGVYRYSHSKAYGFSVRAIKDITNTDPATTIYDADGNAYGVVNITADINIVNEATGSAIPDATLKGYLAEGQRTNVVLNSATLATQNVTVSATPYTLSFYGTGSVALSGVHTGSLAGTGATNRVSLTFTPTAGTLTLTVTGSVTSAQLEEGAFASSYIPTTTGSVTRNADVLSYPSNALGTAGTAYSEIRTLWTAQNDKNAHVLSIGSSRPALFFDNTDGKLSLNDGTDRTGNVFTGSASQQKIASVWGGSVSKTFIAGTASAGLGFDGDMNVGTMNVGSDSSSINQLYGTIRNVKIWKKALSDAKLTSITT